MGLFSTLLGKNDYYCGTASFTVSGTLADVRAFIKERCTKKGHNGTKNTKELWLGNFEVSKGKVQEDTISQMMFTYTRDYNGNNIEFSGVIAGKDTTTVTIKYVTFCGSEKEAQKMVDVIQEAIVERFAQK